MAREFMTMPALPVAEMVAQTLPRENQAEAGQAGRRERPPDAGACTSCG